MHTQGQERVNCLKIKKRENWVNYLTEQCKNTSSQQYNKKKLKKIKKKMKKVIAGEETRTDVLQSITNIIINPSKKWKELMSKDYLMTQTFFIKHKHHEVEYQKKMYQTIITCYSKIKKIQTITNKLKSVGNISTNNM